MIRVTFKAGPNDGLQLEAAELQAVSHAVTVGGKVFFLVPTSDRCRAIVAGEEPRPGPGESLAAYVACRSTAKRVWLTHHAFRHWRPASEATEDEIRKVRTERAEVERQLKYLLTRDPWNQGEPPF